MSKRLKSVGLDVGTTSTQLIVSELEVENQAGSFSVPQMEITKRKIVYQSPVHFTPLKDESHIDGQRLKELVKQEYQRAGISSSQVDTGAVIITGETSRKENAREVLQSLSEFAGDFVVTTAGPDLESVLAAKGAGAVEFSAVSGKTVLHMDIGGGTSNLALIRDGNIVQTGCLNVGGRLIKVDMQGKVEYVSPALEGLCPLRLGMTAAEEQIEQVADCLVQALEMAAGLREPTALLDKLTTVGTEMKIPQETVVVSFSGGVADCIEQVHAPFQFGDIGPILGQKIRKSRLCEGKYRLGAQTIRATVIGAGCHSTQLSGSTVFYQNIAFPLRDLPVVCIPQCVWEQGAGEISQWLQQQKRKFDSQPLFYLQGQLPQGYTQLRYLAEKLTVAIEKEALIALAQDAAKALGQAMAGYAGKDRAVLCMDGLRLREEDYLDVGAPVGPAIPVVVKTLIFDK